MSHVQNKMLLRSIRVEKSNIGYIKWLLESHDGMATPTTRDGTAEVLDFLVAPDFAEEFDELLANLEDELYLESVSPPDKPPLGG